MVGFQRAKARHGRTDPDVGLQESIGKAVYAYVGRWIGPREKIGNKGGSLSNRLRAALQS